MNNNEIRTWQNETALQRFQMISPLLEEGLDASAKVELRKKIAADNNLSERTLRRYEQSYRERSFEGLLPQSRAKPGPTPLPANFDELLAEAIQLKREVPTRSVNQIIYILEGEGRVAPGVLTRSTLQRYLYEAGFGQKQMRRYVEARESSSKRFCKPHRMMLVQADIKYGPDLPDPQNSKKKIHTYLSSVIDDHSRYILHSRFYDNQRAEIVEDSFRQSILRYGKFDKGYVDNGSQYVATDLKDSMARLGITICHAPVRSGKSKGKVEKFHQVVDRFLAESKVHNVKTLDDLNYYWECYLEEYYQKRPHSGIAEYYKTLGVTVPERGISPLEEWNRDKRQLTFLDTDTVAEAFRRHATREIDQAGCFTFEGTLYEASVALIGAKVEISYDPGNTETIDVHYQNMPPMRAKAVRIGPQADPKPPLPVAMQEEVPDSSRMLEVVEKQNRESRKKYADAISYSDFWKGGE